MDEAYSKSVLEEAISNASDVRLQHEQTTLIETMERMIEQFDSDLIKLVRVRKDKSVQVKYAELIIIMLYEELKVMAVAEAEDIRLLAKVEAGTRTLEQTNQEIELVEADLRVVSTDLQRYKTYLAEIHEKVDTELFDNKHVEHLTKFFHIQVQVREDPEASRRIPFVRVESVDPIRLQHPADISLEALAFVDEMRSQR